MNSYKNPVLCFCSQKKLLEKQNQIQTNQVNLDKNNSCFLRLGDHFFGCKNSIEMTESKHSKVNMFFFLWPNPQVFRSFFVSKNPFFQKSMGMWKTFEDDNFGLQNCRSSMFWRTKASGNTLPLQVGAKVWMPKTIVTHGSKKQPFRPYQMVVLLHPRKLTWIPKIAICEMRFILKTHHCLESMLWGGKFLGRLFQRFFELTNRPFITIWPINRANNKFHCLPLGPCSRTKPQTTELLSPKKCLATEQCLQISFLLDVFKPYKMVSTVYTACSLI